MMDTAADQRQATTNERWEYRCAWVADEEDESELNALGRDGWELVGVTQSGNGVRLYLKRPGIDFRERVTLEQKRRYLLGYGIAVPDFDDRQEQA